MRKSLNRVLATIATGAMVASMFASIAPVSAADATAMKDTLAREKISTSSLHTLSLTLPSFTFGTTVSFDYSVFTLTPGALGSMSIGAGTVTAVASATGVDITCTAGPCSGAFTGTFTGTNPGSSGSKTIAITSTNGSGVTGSFAIPIVDEDQITVTASVDPSITFVASAQAGQFEAYTCDDATSLTAGGTVALGTLTTGSITSSDVGAVRHICTRVSTNATTGAIVTVKSASNNGLTSTSVPGDTIPSASAAMAAGTANYGLCAGDRFGSATTTPSSAQPVQDSPYDQTCTNDASAGTVGLVDTTARTVWHVTTPTAAAFQNLVVKAAISGTTRAHSDYTDTLTFVATGTF